MHGYAGPLVGREGEVVVLLRALDEACTGHGQLVLVEGEAGSGKTRLVAEVAEVAARRGMRVVRISGTLDAVGHALAQATPAVPVLVLLDDPGAPDETLLESLAAAVPRLAGLPALVLATVLEPGPCGSGSSIARTAGPVQRLVAGALPIGAVAALAHDARLDVPARALQRLHHVTGGNALLVVESLAAITRTGAVPEDEPWPLSDRAIAWMRGRLSALPVTSRDAVEVASVLGETCDVTTIAQVLGDGADVMRVRLALDASVLVHIAGPGHCRFLPPLARDLVQASLGAAHRAELHARAEAALADDVTAGLAHRSLAAAAMGDARRAEIPVRRLAALAAQTMPRAPATPPSGVPHLACEGAYWVIGFGGRSVRLPERLGFIYLAHLLARPGVEVAALALAGSARTGGTTIDALDDGGPAAQRARVSVTRRIRDAIDRITAVHPACGAHLARTIRTGTRCAYMVDPSVSPSWDVRWSV